MKLIFLDFDGVLNSERYFRSESFKDKTKDLSDAQIMMTNIHHHLDPEAIGILNELVEESQAQVVISSSWRLLFSVDKLNELLQSRGAKFTAIGQTPCGTPKKFSLPVVRGDEIADYILSLNEKPTNIVILDDVPNMGKMSKYLVSYGL